MKSSYNFKRSAQYGMSTLELSAPAFELQIKIVSQLGKRERSEVVRSFFRQIKPLLRYYTNGSLNHAAHGLNLNQRNRERGVKDFSSRPLTTEAGQIGFEIRMARLKIGLTQDQLAESAGIKRSHLSDIERGVYRPSKKTLEKLKRSLDN